MKQLFISLFSLCFLLLMESHTTQRKELVSVFKKVIFIEFDAKKDSSLFVPLSKAWLGSWNYLQADLSVMGSPIMNIDSYKATFKDAKQNMWTLLHPNILSGVLTMYYPYDPNSFQVRDEGELRYSIKGVNANKKYFSSQEVRDEMTYYLGRFGPSSDTPLANSFGEDSIIMLPDGTFSYVYPPRDFLWYKDKDIVKYKVRVNILVDKNGVEKKRVIESIAPMVAIYDEGELIGERELFWLNYNQLKPLLKKGYYFRGDGKPVTFLKHIEDKVVSYFE